MFKWLQSLVSDKDFDTDATKLFGVALIIVGVVGWFMGHDPAWIIGFGSALVASGKFSAQG